MGAPAVFVGLSFLAFVSWTHGMAEVEWACRDRYLWIHVLSKETVLFEAVDPDGAHAISAAVASRCGYTVSAFKTDGFTVFRASYYSCFTSIQDDQVFTFQFNVMVSDGDSEWTRQTVSAECSGLNWIRREIVCEEDYMEVNVGRKASCTAQPGPAGEAGQAALAQALETASSASRLMFQQRDGHLTPMSITEAESRGYGLTLTAERAVLRVPYKAAEAQMIQVDDVPIVVVGVFLFYKQQLSLVMIDMSVACTVNSGSYDGAHLIWEVPRVLRPLLEEGAVFKSLQHSLEVEGVMLDIQRAAASGFNLVQRERLVQISVPFGAEGGHRRSLVANNVYKETFAISLLYEHHFMAEYPDGSSVETKVRIVRVLQTPLLCQKPFTVNQTNTDDEVFSIYLGNIPSDVILEEIHVNKQLLTEPRDGFTVTPVVHLNGSQAYIIQLPFSEPVVRRKYMGEGVVQYSIDVNFTLTIMPQMESYYHYTVVTAEVFIPPKITAQCMDRGIHFSVVIPPGAQSLWEVGVDHEPLTPQLAVKRGYKLLNDSQNIILEVPVLSIGYTYEDINLSDFYGTFKLLLRDARSLEVQTSTTKHCLFKTEEMIVCSADGTVTVVTRPAWTWPTVQPERTSLLDPTCRPKQTDATRVLFEFKLDSCGTRATVGDYVVYENEILHDRQLIADGPNFISRDSQFKLTVRCYYQLSEITRVSADRISRSETTGVGSIEVFGHLTDPKNLQPARDCIEQLSRNESKQARGKAKLDPEQGPSRVTTKPGVPKQPHVNSPKIDENIPSSSSKSTSSAQSQLGDGFPWKNDYSETRVANGFYDDSRADKEARTPVRNWYPLSQNDLLKPNGPRWSFEEEPSFSEAPEVPFDADQRPGDVQISPLRIPVAQIPAESSQNPLSNANTRVQNIRVKPHRRVNLPNPSQKVHSQSSGSAAEGSGPFDRQRKRPHFAESQGKTFSALRNDFQMAGTSQSMTRPGLGGFLPAEPVRMSDGGSSPKGANHKDPGITRYTNGMDTPEVNVGSIISQRGTGGNSAGRTTSGESKCHKLSAQYGGSIHQGIIRAMEGFQLAGSTKLSLASNS